MTTTALVRPRPPTAADSTARDRRGWVTIGLLAVLLALPVAALVPGPSRAIGHPLSGVGSAPSTAWSPASHRSSPTAPHMYLRTVSRATASCAPSAVPAWLAYDHFDRSVWVAAPAHCVEVFGPNLFTLRASITVGSNPFGVAVDNASQDVFVTNSGSGTVSVLSTSKLAVIATVPVGKAPMGVAFDWRSGDVFVANHGSNNVTAISGTTLKVVANIATGSGPIGVVADPTSHQVFVAGHSSNTVTVISTSTLAVATTVAVGGGPYGIALDNLTDQVYVTNELSQNLSVLFASNDTARGTIAVASPFFDLQGIAFDARRGEFWVGAGRFYAIIIDAKNDTVAGYSATDPSGVAYDPDNGYVCVTNTDNFTYACMTGWPAWAQHTVPLTFSESGLPTGTTWSVSLWELGNPKTVSSSSGRTIPFQVEYWFGLNLDAYNFSIRPIAGYYSTPTVGVANEYGHPLVVSVKFTPIPSTVNVSFAESRLRAGTTWYVNLTNVSTGKVTAVSGTGGWLNATLPSGNYSFTVQAHGYLSSRIHPSSGTLRLVTPTRSVAVVFG